MSSHRQGEGAAEPGAAQGWSVLSLRSGRSCWSSAASGLGCNVTQKLPRAGAGWKAALSPLRLPSSHLARCCLEQNQTRGPVLRPLCSSHPSISITCSFRYPAM